MPEMGQIARILLLTDFSEISENATLYAMQIARKTKAEVEILHVINTPVDWVKIPLEKEKLYPEIKEEIVNVKSKLMELTRRFSDHGIEAQYLYVFNFGVEDIVQHINLDNVDLLVMGSHGAKGIKEWTLGSNAQKVLRNILRPVLVVKHKPSRAEIKSIVFASTFEEQQKNAFVKFMDIAEHLNTELHLLYVNTPYNFKETHESEQLLNSHCERITKKVCIKHTYNALNEERGIKYFMENSDTDIFSIATSGRSGLARIFSPSLTESLVNHLDIPLLSIHLE